MPDSAPIDLGRYSVFVPPDPFEDHMGPIYYRLEGDARQLALAGHACGNDLHAVHFHRADGERLKTTPLDQYGEPSKVQESFSGKVITLLPDTTYYLISTE